MSGNRTRRENKKRRFTKGALCNLKGSDKQGIYQGMRNNLAVLKTVRGEITVPLKNIERVV